MLKWELGLKAPFAKRGCCPVARPRLAHYVDIESRTASNSKATGGSSEVSLFHRSASVTHRFLVHQATTKFLCQGRHLYQCPAASNKCSGTLSGDFRDLFGRSARLSCQLAIVCSHILLDLVRCFGISPIGPYRFSLQRLALCNH